MNWWWITTKSVSGVFAVTPPPHATSLTRAGLENEFREQLTAVESHVEQANKSDAAFERVAAEHRLEQERR